MQNKCGGYSNKKYFVSRSHALVILSAMSLHYKHIIYVYCLVNDTLIKCKLIAKFYCVFTTNLHNLLPNLTKYLTEYFYYYYY